MSRMLIGMGLGFALAVCFAGLMVAFVKMAMWLEPHPMGFFLGVALMICTAFAIIGFFVVPSMK